MFIKDGGMYHNFNNKVLHRLVVHWRNKKKSNFLVAKVNFIYNFLI